MADIVGLGSMPELREERREKVPPLVNCQFCEGTSWIEGERCVTCRGGLVSDGEPGSESYERNQVARNLKPTAKQAAAMRLMANALSALSECWTEELGERLTGGHLLPNRDLMEATHEFLNIAEIGEEQS